MSVKISKSFELNSKWTHLSGFMGWKHFRIVTIRKGELGKEVELMAVCDRDVRIWLERNRFKED